MAKMRYELQALRKFTTLKSELPGKGACYSLTVFQIPDIFNDFILDWEPLKHTSFQKSRCSYSPWQPFL